jgi:hypothetical protein
MLHRSTSLCNRCSRQQSFQARLRRARTSYHVVRSCWSRSNDRALRRSPLLIARPSPCVCSKSGRASNTDRPTHHTNAYAPYRCTCLYLLFPKAKDAGFLLALLTAFTTAGASLRYTSQRRSHARTKQMRSQIRRRCCDLSKRRKM